MKTNTSTILVGITTLLASCAGTSSQQPPDPERMQAEWKVCADDQLMFGMVAAELLQMDDAGLVTAQLIETECGDGGLDLAARTEHIFDSVLAMETDPEAFLTDFERRKAALADS